MWSALREPQWLLWTVGLCLSGCAALPDRPWPWSDAEPEARYEANAESGKPTGLAAWSPKNVTGTVKEAVGLGPDQQLAEERFREAEAEFQSAVAARRQGNESESQKRFESASEKYLGAAKRWPKSRLEEDALFWAGEACFFADQYPKASKTYDSLVKKYPNTRHMDTVATRQFSLAEYWLQLDDDDPDWAISPNLTDSQRPRFDTFGNALKVFDRIRFDDPTGKLSDDATMAAANANFRAGKFRRADTLYADLRESFPDSEHQFNAHLLGVKCKLMAYEGPDYDGAVLDQAEDLVKQMFRVFPDEAAQHREYLERSLGEIRLKKAEREWAMAQYYDRRKEYGAARSYYGIVRRDYADTNLAQEAGRRLAEISDRPDVPPQRLEWLADLFPEPETAKPLIARTKLDTKRR